MTTTQARNARKNQASPLIRLPKALKARVERLRDELQESYEAGRIDLPDHVDCEKIPLSYVIEKALDELEDHRARSRKARKNQNSPR